MEQLSGIILAAGLSSRMGTFKPLLSVEGMPMIMHVLGMMLRAGAEHVVVVTGHRHEDLEEVLAGIPQVELVFNPEYAHTQQLESLRLALTALDGRTERVMISPADVPMVSDETVKMIRDTEGDFVRPVFHGEMGHPVFLRAEWFSYLMSYEGPGGLRGAMERSSCHLVELSVEDRGTVLDNDTPADIERLLKWHREQEESQT